MEYKNLPLYIVDFTDESIFENVAIVNSPAIQYNFIRLAEQAEIKFSVDEERRVISGPVLVPEQPIYRKVGGKEFYIKFTEDAIRRYAIKFFQDKREGEGNVEHQFPVQGITYFESYLVDRERGIAPKAFDVPDGTWIMSAKVDNDDVWKLILAGELRGFSVDIISSISEAKEEEETPLDTVEDLLNYLKSNK